MAKVFKGHSGHVSYYVNVGQVVGIVGAIVIAWRALDKLEDMDGKIEIDGKTVERVADEVGRTIRYKTLWG